MREVPANTCTSHNPPRKGTWARDYDSYQQPTHQTSTGRVRRPLGHSEGVPPLDTCAQPAATPHPYPEGPETASDGAARSPELSVRSRQMDSGDTSKTIPTKALSWSQLMHSIRSDTPLSVMEHSCEYKLRTKTNIRAGMESSVHSQVERAHEPEKGQIQDCTRSSKYFKMVQVNEDQPGIDHIQDFLISIKLQDEVQLNEDQQGIEHIQDCMRSIKLHDVVQVNEDQQGIEHIQDYIRSIKLRDVVQVNEDQQGIENIQDCIRSIKLCDVVQANEKNKQGMEHMQYCMRSNKHYELVQVNEHENQQGRENIHNSMKSALHYEGLQEHGSKNQQGMEHHQDNIRLPLLLKPREYVEHQSINNFLETSGSDDSDALEKLNQAAWMSSCCDELLDLVEDRDLQGDGNIFLFREVACLIEVLHQHGVNIIRSGVVEELENLNQKHVDVENDIIRSGMVEELENLNQTYVDLQKELEIHYLEVMLRICDNEMCEEAINRIIGKAEKGQVFCYE
ncbi:hypothetical protein AgCh_018417 [Apium graveolens]